MLSSQHNPVIKTITAVQTKKGRAKHRLFLAEGPHLVQEAFRSPLGVKSLVIVEERDRSAAEREAIMEEAKARGIALHYITRSLCKKISETENPQGILALVNLPTEESRESLSPRNFLGLMLNEIQDPGNLGTILRTAWGAGLKDIFITPGTVDPFSGKAVRSSQGGIFHLTIHHQRAEEIINWAKRQGVTIVSGNPRGERVYYEYDFTQSTLILLGNEGRGPDPLLNDYSLPVAIPLPGGAESLNVATAGGILIFEAIKQRAQRVNKG